MRESDERFLAIGEYCASLLVRYGLGPTDSILDVGSGYGRLVFGLLDVLDFTGRYEGFDVLPRHVAWCQEAITRRRANFRFTLVDATNDRYNPRGSIEASALRFPYDDGSFDFCALFSVFTHMYDTDIKHYLEEIRRVLKEDGSCLATFFLFNDERLATVTAESCPLPMRYQLGRVCRYFNPDNVLHAISYDDAYVRSMWEEAGLTVVATEYGPWAGDRPDAPPGSYQDVVVGRRRSARPVSVGQ